MKKTKTALSLLLTLALVLSLGGTAWAEDAPDTVEIVDNNGTVTVAVNGGTPSKISGTDITIVSVSDNGCKTSAHVNNAIINVHSDAQISVTGDVSGKSGNPALSVESSQSESGGQSVSGQANVSVTGSVKGGTTGVSLQGLGGVVNVSVTGGVAAGTDGVAVTSGDESLEISGFVYVDVGGSVSGESGGGVRAKADNNSTAFISAGGGISGGEAGIIAEANGAGTVGVSAVGDVTGEKGIVIGSVDGSYAEVALLDPINGITTSAEDEDLMNVRATTTGVEIQKSENAWTNVTIDGVLSVEGGGTPILLGDTVTENDVGNISITVWKIEGQGDGAVVSGGAAGSGAAGSLQSSINYIVKIAPDADSRTVFSGYSGGAVMLEGESEIELSVPAGCTLSSTYATDGTAVPITQRDGKYYAVIPAGGGIYLHASLSKPSSGEIPAEDFSFSYSIGVKKLAECSDSAQGILLSFYRDGSYTAILADGRGEGGNVRLDGDSLVLVSQFGTKMPVGADGSLVYLFGGREDLRFELKLSADDMALLREALA